jgi:diguanylate cyclase (GGDEF)-like protein
MATTAIDVSRLTENRDQQYQLLCLQNQVLESIINLAPDDQLLLDQLCVCAEALTNHSVASVMLFDDERKTLRVAAAPNASSEIIDLLKQIDPANAIDDCARALLSDQPVYLNKSAGLSTAGNIQQLTQTRGLASCWSQPISMENGAIAGSFALAGHESDAPDKFQKGLLQVCANLAGIILQRQQTQHKLWQIAHHDALTGLPNRYFVDSQLRHAIANAGRTSKGLALMYIDMDNFKDINDSYGHDFGDKVLLASMSKIRNCLREQDIVARLGGDEFLLILENLGDRLAVEVIAKKILRSFHRPMKIGEQQIMAHFSIGVSMFPFDGKTPADLLKHADIAMYEAKRAGKNSVCYFRKELSDQILQKVRLEQEIREGLALREFSMYYQPQYQGNSDQIVAVEALIRWHHPERGTLLPEEFIPIASQSPLINEIGRFVLQEVCLQGARWIEEGLRIPRISVNIGQGQLLQNCADLLKELFRVTGFPADHLELEITEALILERGAGVLEQLRRIRNLGVSLVMDDFGTGFTSLSQLSTLPINKIKIDDSFIEALDQDEDQILVKTMIAMGQNLSIQTVGEGVESRAQMDFLVKNGCDYIQGNLRQTPLPAAELEHMLLSRLQ